MYMQNMSIWSRTAERQAISVVTFTRCTRVARAVVVQKPVQAAADTVSGVQATSAQLSYWYKRRILLGGKNDPSLLWSSPVLYISFLPLISDLRRHDTDNTKCVKI